MAFQYTVQKTDTGGLNSIVQRYGFSNYKAAGVSAVPSGNFDVIKPGDVISLGNYDPSKVSGITPTSPVVSSTDSKSQFASDSSNLSTQSGSLNPPDLGAPVKEDTTTTQDPNATGAKNADGTTNTTGDPVLDKLNSWEADQKAAFTATAEQNKADYESLFQTQLANIDSTTQATIDNINSTYDKRVQEQQRINDLNIARVKAYGLGNGGQYTPISYGDAVSVREQTAADSITSLNNERTSLISQAQAAASTGKAGLLKDKMAALDDINTKLNSTLADVATEANNQYNLLRQVRQDAETKHQADLTAMQSRLAAIAPKYLDEYSGLDDKSKDSFITKLSAQTGLDYATVYGIMQSAAMSASTAATAAAKDKLTTQSTELDIAGKQLDNAKKAKDLNGGGTEGVQKYLADQGLPLNTADTSGEITTASLQKVVDNGVSLDVAKGIWNNMKNGTSFDEIRKGIKDQGGDPAILDRFVEALQE